MVDGIGWGEVCERPSDRGTHCPAGLDEGAGPEPAA